VDYLVIADSFGARLKGILVRRQGGIAQNYRCG
jgi:hypothetical protein